MSQVRIYMSHDATEWTMVDADEDTGKQVDVDDVPMSLVHEFHDGPDPYYDDLPEPERTVRNIRRTALAAFAAGVHHMMLRKDEEA